VDCYVVGPHVRACGAEGGFKVYYWYIHVPETTALDANLLLPNWIRKQFLLCPHILTDAQQTSFPFLPKFILFIGLLPRTTYAHFLFQLPTKYHLLGL
jgi:hypothetical protein